VSRVIHGLCAAFPFSSIETQPRSVSSLSAQCVAQIGHGKKTYEQAKDAIQRWHQFQLGWANVDSSTPVSEGAFVCVEAQPIPVLPIWTACPLKIMCE
jgi:uncharacterized protein (UPF0548 family)